MNIIFNPVPPPRPAAAAAGDLRGSNDLLRPTNMYGRANESECATPCAGNASLTCGGPGRNALYSLTAGERRQGLRCVWVGGGAGGSQLEQGRLPHRGSAPPPAATLGPRRRPPPAQAAVDNRTHRTRDARPPRRARARAHRPALLTAPVPLPPEAPAFFRIDVNAITPNTSAPPVPWVHPTLSISDGGVVVARLAGALGGVSDGGPLTVAWSPRAYGMRRADENYLKDAAAEVEAAYVKAGLYSGRSKLLTPEHLVITGSTAAGVYIGEVRVRMFGGLQGLSAARHAGASTHVFVCLRVPPTPTINQSMNYTLFPTR